MMKYIYCLVLLAFIKVDSYGNNLTIATETAIDTWWYFKHAISYPTLNQRSFCIRTQNGEWITKLKWDNEFGLSGTLLLDQSTQATINIKDSSYITDWLFVENDKMIGAFTLRISGVKKKQVEELSAKLQAKFIKDKAISNDFIDASYLPDMSEKNKADSSISAAFAKKSGGEKAITASLTRGIKYPPFAIAIGLQGYSYYKLVISPAGRIEDIITIQSIGGGTSAAVHTVINKFDANEYLKIGKRYTLILPVKFKLE
ncbi:MAG: energy transducer TonB [Bacteroidia bacterium]|nr:energy transducer TonB [Bacteroidia bacterium]